MRLTILKLIWRRPLVRLAGLVLLANLVSAAVGTMVELHHDDSIFATAPAFAW